MNLHETVRLLGLVTALWPHARLEDATPDAWALVLDDVPADDALRAVKRLAQTEARPPSVADVRREVARAAGLLSPDEDEAWMLATNVASRSGEGRSRLPLAVQAAYDTLGGSQGIRGGRSDTTRAQFRDAYRLARTRIDQDVLADGLGVRLHLASIDRPAVTA